MITNVLPPFLWFTVYISRHCYQPLKLKACRQSTAKTR